MKTNVVYSVDKPTVETFRKLSIKDGRKMSSIVEYYIKQYKAKLLLMGDDWKDKFDSLDIRVIHIPRTPNISSSLLRSMRK